MTVESDIYQFCLSGGLQPDPGLWREHNRHIRRYVPLIVQEQLYDSLWLFSDRETLSRDTGQRHCQLLVAPTHNKIINPYNNNNSYSRS